MCVRGGGGGGGGGGRGKGLRGSKTVAPCMLVSVLDFLSRRLCLYFNRSKILAWNHNNGISWVSSRGNMI